MIETHPHTHPQVVALILAGGVGQRIDSEVPKQYLRVKGECLIHRTLRAFAPYVDQLLVVCRSEWRDLIREATLSTPLTTADAGTTGFESLCSGVASLSHLPDDVLIMVHDAVRPLVSGDIITTNLEVARTKGNAVAAVTTYETLLSAPAPDGVVRSLTRREGMFRAQTPQTFTLGALRQMIAEARQLCILDAQSPCILAYQLGYELHLSPGDLRNFKITTPSDLNIFESLI